MLDPMTLSDFDARSVWPKTTKLGMVTHVGEGRVYRGQPRGSSVIQIFGTSYTYAHTVWETATKFCVVIKLDQ